jgi:hypothetical protein
MLVFFLNPSWQSLLPFSGAEDQTQGFMLAKQVLCL